MRKRMRVIIRPGSESREMSVKSHPCGHPATRCARGCRAAWRRPDRLRRRSTLRAARGRRVVRHLEDRDRRAGVCVKRALARLRSQPNGTRPWSATRARPTGAPPPGDRPEAVPGLLHSEEAGRPVFAMAYLDPGIPGWKTCARRRVFRRGRRGGRRVGRSTPRRQTTRPAPGSRPTRSSTRSASSPICYGAAHADLADGAARSPADRDHGAALVHGDVSPKNILIGPNGPVFLDAECAWFGDPAFDLAFCLNHLLLKCLWSPRRRRNSSMLRRARRALPRPCGLGDRDGAGRAGRASAAGTAARPGRRQVAGGVSHRRERTRRRARGGARPADQPGRGSPMCVPPGRRF